MSGEPTLRPFRAGDEVQIADLFNHSVARFLGPFTVTPESWREQYRRRTWRGPGLRRIRNAFMSRNETAASSATASPIMVNASKPRSWSWLS